MHSEIIGCIRTSHLQLLIYSPLALYLLFSVYDILNLLCKGKKNSIHGAILRHRSERYPLNNIHLILDHTDAYQHVLYPFIFFFFNFSDGLSLFVV
jgi:hypothetical protein